MAFPAFLPSSLMQNVTRDETSLVDSLKININQLVTFFEYACADETWSEKHPVFMSKTMQWLTMQFILEQLDQRLLLRVAKAIQEHYTNLKTLLPVDIIVKVGKESIRMNSLLMAAASSLLQDRLRDECIEQNISSLTISDLPLSTFQIFREFINTGKIEGLWKKEDQELLDLLRYSTRYELTDLSKEIANILKRYFSPYNALSFLKQSLDEHLPELTAAATEYFDQLDLGVKLPKASNEELFLEFTDFSDRTIEIFESIKDSVTHIICRGFLSTQTSFLQIVNNTPHLVGLDISGSSTQPEGLDEVGRKLELLDLSRCEWLTDEKLKKVITQCPHLVQFILSSNTQLTHRSWGDLQKLKGLYLLDLANCIQLKDEDLKLILTALPNLRRLNLNGCKRLTDEAFSIIAKQVPNMRSLFISRSQLTHAALKEIFDKCVFLESLDISRCPNLSEKSIMEVIKRGHALREVKLTVSPETLEVLKQQHPYIQFSEE